MDLNQGVKRRHVWIRLASPGFAGLFGGWRDAPTVVHMRIPRSRLLWMGVLIAPLLCGCAFGQGRVPASKSASATSAEEALAGFSPEERERILAVQDVIEQAAAEREIDPSLINAIIWVESRFDANAQSPAGARGLMQLMPSTAAYLAKRMGESRARANDPEFNIRAGSLYLAEMISKFGDETQAVAAYHAGPGNVAKWVAAKREFPEWSNEYVTKVLAARERFRDLPQGERASRVSVLAEPTPAEPRDPPSAEPSDEPIAEPSDDEPSDAPDPDTLPDATEVRRMAAEPAPSPVPEPSPELELEPEPEQVFEVHPEADANPNAGPPPGWPTRSQPETAPKPKPKSKSVLAVKQPTPPTHTEQAPGLGVLPDL